MILRPFTENDCRAMYRIQSKPEMTKYTPDEPWMSMDDAYNFLNFAKSLYADQQVIKGFRYFFAVQVKESGVVIGYCGLGGPEFDRTLTEVFIVLTAITGEMGMQRKRLTLC
ncbi:GNAT family N-acetyltransferase [Alicyclobacillus dauci]|uniref:GNAT family N-acetyltransferase n=1 Tax=Alicyclobacillus dauci TaxID=1475485 RepID=A0ABY6YZ41_9BACL|nr:GNAT family N-acetyltransferase [Alicyclobacillus dauci]WAH35884.1 GNAT family N-acetyltransferase [Alicyclobacillus dauci]